MHTTLSKWLSIALLLVLLTIPLSAHAQGEVAFDNLTVQLWPEFDQPAMLVIYDFTLVDGTSLPVDVTLHVPTDATIIAVAFADAGGLLNATYQDPLVEGDQQVLTLTVDTKTTYHVEYYSPLTRTDSQRDYTYLWPGDYAVNTLNVSIRLPGDTTDVSTTPIMADNSLAGDAQKLLTWSTTGLEAGEQVPIQVTYNKTSDQLSAAGQPLEAGNIDESTPGRVSLNNYLPYILGGLGVVLILAGGIYFWMSSQGKSIPGRRRHRSQSDQDEDGDVYCSQCGKRAKSGDRFCRTCGTRLRRET